MAFFYNAQNVDARYGTFNEVAGDQLTDYNDRRPRETAAGRDDLDRTETQTWDSRHTPVDFSSHINDEWDVCIHPDGWKYFYRAGLITEHEHVAKQPLSLGLLRELPGDYYEEVLSSTLKSSPVSKRIYVNHALWYASPDKDAATRTDHTLQEGRIVLCCSLIPMELISHQHLSFGLRTGILCATTHHTGLYILEPRALRAII